MARNCSSILAFVAAFALVCTTIFPVAQGQDLAPAPAPASDGEFFIFRSCLVGSFYWECYCWNRFEFSDLFVDLMLFWAAAIYFFFSWKLMVFQSHSIATRAICSLYFLVLGLVAGTTIDQGIAYVLMLLALVLTYIIHTADVPVKL